MRHYILAFSILTALLAVFVPGRFVPVVPTAQALSTGVVISQIYGGGGNNLATYTNDFIELFNRGNTTVDVSGWSVQYASAGGNSWAVTNLCSSTTPNTCTIPAGTYYLVQEAQGAGGSTALPTPVNATGTIAMSATTGKVALVNTRTAITTGTTCPTSLASVVDFVGFGSTSTTPSFCFEGSGPTPAPSNTTAVLRAANGCTETDNNNTDFAAGAPTPRNSASPTNLCGGGDAAPTVSSTTPASSANNVAVNADVTITFSEPVTVSSSSFTISCGTSGAHTFALTGSSASYTLNPNTDFANNETCTVTVVANQVSDQDAADPPDNMAANYVFTFNTIVSAGSCGDPYRAIFQIQGSSTASPDNGVTRVTEGVVVGDFQGSANLSGFYIQDPGGDGNTSTSDGIYVFDGATPAVNVSVGDRVRVLGTVSEAFNNTQITPTGPPQICSTGNSLPAATVVDLPETINDDLERYENMLVVFPETLTVTGNFNYGRFGELVLSSDGRRFQQNSFDRPNTPGALARASLNQRSYVVLDDGKSAQNPNPIPYLSPDNTRRAGDTTTGLTGVLTFDFSEYRVQPTAAVTFAQANPRPVGPPAVSGTLRVASSNVLNYFNGDGTGGGFPTARGATTAAEFARQRAKIIAAITTLNPDVLGVSEMENDGFGANSALQDLINGLNAATAPGTYAGIDSPNPGTDLIKNAIIYKPSAVTTIGAAVNDIDAAWNQARPPLAQTFQQNSNGERFTFIVTHFTSKGCSASDTGIDADAGDGQGCDNGQRKLQASRLLVFIQDRKTASGDPDVLSMGDYNAYGEEDPLFMLEQDASDTLSDGAGGLVSESKRFVPQAERYSFQFDEAFGELDHAFATKSMNNQVSGTTIWHINADEPVVIDYNTEFKTQDLYTPTPFRASDHDPLLIGLNLTSAATESPSAFIISEFRFRGPGDDTAAPNNEFIEFYNNTNSDITVSTTDGSAGWACVASDGQVRFIIPNATVIPSRGHFLAVNTGGYSLANYGGTGAAAGDQVLLPDGVTLAAGYTTDIPDGAGIALFRTSTPASFVLDERLDAAGYTGAGTLYREGAGFPATGLEISNNLQYSFYRDLCAFVQGIGCTTNGFPKDTGNNTADFLGVDVNAALTGAGQRLGAPGPENLSSPINHNATFGAFLLDSSQGANSVPNRVRDTTSNPANNATLGTLSLRRRFTNNTGLPVARLRFRIVDITTFPRPNSATADIRALSSGQLTNVSINDSATCAATGTPTTAPCTVTVEGLTLEEPPSQPNGGGYNATLSAGTINLAQPLAAGASINVNFLLGVQASGSFRFLVNVEALPNTSPVAAEGDELVGAPLQPMQLPGPRQQ